MTWVVATVALFFGFFLGRLRGSQENPSSVHAKESGDDVAKLLDGIDAGVVVVDSQGVVLHINSVAHQLFDRVQALHGQSLSTVVLGADMLAMLSEEKEGIEVFEMKMDPERLIQVRVTHVPLGGAVFVMHDITEIKHLEVVRSDFVANVSHELRTPVSVIRANAETLLDGALDDADVAHEFVSAIHRNSERISNLVSDLLDLARLEAGSASLSIVEVEVSQVVARTVGSMQTIANEKSITIHNDVSESILCLGDEDALEQVLTNLVENAVKYGVSQGNVWVRGYQTPGRIRVEVIDDGPGIEAIHRTRLFERFYRVDKGRSRASGGTGLGLSIVKHLVTGMNGQVGIEPNRPSGAVFWIALPACQADPEFLSPA